VPGTGCQGAASSHIRSALASKRLYQSPSSLSRRKTGAESPAGRSERPGRTLRASLAKSAIGLRPATSADAEFCYQLHKAAMGEYVTAIWGWDEQVQSVLHERAFSPHRWQIRSAASMTTMSRSSWGAGNNGLVSIAVSSSFFNGPYDRYVPDPIDATALLYGWP
jgi:hypothetical protein